MVPGSAPRSEISAAAGNKFRRHAERSRSSRGTAPSPDQVVFRLGAERRVFSARWRGPTVTVPALTLRTRICAEAPGEGDRPPVSSKLAMASGPVRRTTPQRDMLRAANGGRPRLRARVPRVDRVRLSIGPEPAAAESAIQAANLDLWPSMDPKFAGEAEVGRLVIASAPVAS